MERTLSVEEKIRRAEEIYARRHEENFRPTATVTVGKDNKKDIKLLKKLIIQIIVCILIYLVIYTIQNSQFIFSQDFINKANEILSYDTNFQELYNNGKNFIMSLINNFNSNEGNNVTEQNLVENTVQENQTNQDQTQNVETNNIDTQAIGGATETPTEISNTGDSQTELTQEEQDLNNINNTTTFIKPIYGVITSRYGLRNPTTTTVPKDHTGTDIAANTGTKIKSATDGEVVLASEEGDYGKHLKIQIGDVSIIYAHCNNLYVKQGDKVVQGQEIAEVGSTGNSTGPHLHFEVRYQERTVDPEKLLVLE